MKKSNLARNKKAVKRFQRKAVEQQVRQSENVDVKNTVTVFETQNYIHILNKTEDELYFYDSGVIDIYFTATVIPVKDYRSAWYEVNRFCTNLTAFWFNFF